MRILLFLSTAAAILASGCMYLGWRLIETSGIESHWSTIGWLALVLLFVVPFGTFLLRVRRVETRATSLLSWIAYSGLALLSFLFTLVVLRDVLWLAGAGLWHVFGDIAHAATPAGAGDGDHLFRSTNLGILGLAVALVGYGVYQARRRPAVPELAVPVEGLHPDLEGLRIVQISDLHAGQTIGSTFVRKVAEQVGSLRPDLIVFTGDLADGSVDTLRDSVEPLARLQAPLGKFFVTGNHEYYSGATSWVEEAKRLGFSVLMNEYAVIRRGSAALLLAGVNDRSAGHAREGGGPHQRSDPRAAVAGAPSCDVRILLAHQPGSLYDADGLGFHLQLSGHTHGGQFFPWNLLARIGQPAIAGLRKFDATWLYVSRGTGYWGPPVRVGAPSEVAVLRLTRAEG